MLTYIRRSTGTPVVLPNLGLLSVVVSSDSTAASCESNSSTRFGDVAKERCDCELWREGVMVARRGNRVLVL